VHGEHAERRIAHVLQLLVGGDVARADQLDAGLRKTQIAECFQTPRSQSCPPG